MGVMDVVVTSRLYGGNVSVLASFKLSAKDRCLAGWWDREQLIGGKAIEPRK
jgi:hypothetical protein